MNNLGKRLLLATAAGCLTLSHVAYAANWYVDASAGTNGNGESWTTPFNNLTSALNNPFLAANDEIWVADGIYKPANQSSSFEIKVGVKVYGGFSGLGDDDIGDRNDDPETNGCVLSGDISGNDTIGDFFTNRSDNCLHVVVADDGEMLPTDTLLDGVTIRGGAGSDGGGIIITGGASPTIRNCIFTDNQGTHGGGAHVADSTPTFRECDFIANRATLHGGGMLVSDCQPIIVQCNFIDNRAIAMNGSGIDTPGTGNGGGVQVIDEGAPKIFNCVFQNNFCGHVGGGLSMRENVTSLQTLVANCVFVGNHAVDSGGGCRVGLESAVRFVNCTFVENSCGVTNHDLQGSGGGLSLGRYIEEADARQAVIDNCIFWNNSVIDSSAQGTQISLIGAYPGTVVINYSNIMDSDPMEDGCHFDAGSTLTFGVGRLDVDPDFVADPDLGNDDYGDLRLNDGSPNMNKGQCSLLPVDAGDVDGDSGFAEELPLDLDLVARKDDRVDLGAFENQTSAMCAGDSNLDGLVNVTDLLAVLSTWGGGWGSNGDVAPFPCLNGAVNTSDLLLVISNWGVCEGGSGDSGASYQEAEYCIDEANQLYTPYSPEWYEYVEECTDE